MNQGLQGFSFPAPPGRVWLKRITVGIDVPAPAPSIRFGDLPQSYFWLTLAMQARGDTAALNTALLARLNDDLGTTYAYTRNDIANVTNQTNAVSATAMQLGVISAATSPANVASEVALQIINYAGTVFHKQITSLGTMEQNTTAANQFVELGAGFWRSNAAVLSITLLPNAGNFVAGSVFSLYASP